MIGTACIGRATLYLADCREIADKLCAAQAIVTDPPYGIGYHVNARDWDGEMLSASNRIYGEPKPPIAGDDKPFDPSPWLAVPRLAFFGANYFARRLPDGGKWIVWDKRRESSPDDHADGELIWTNAPGVLRIHRQKWRGVVREGEENCSRSKKLHPNQKPVALLCFVLQQLGLEPGQTVADPYMGSGSTGVAALRAGHHFIGCEIDPQYFEIACRRLDAETRVAA